MRTLFAPFFFIGRVLLWILFWPVGLWRSIRHGRRKSERKIIDAMDRKQSL